MNKKLNVHCVEEFVKIKIYCWFIWKNIIERKNKMKIWKIKKKDQVKILKNKKKKFLRNVHTAINVLKKMS